MLKVCSANWSNWRTILKRRVLDSSSVMFEKFSGILITLVFTACALVIHRPEQEITFIVRTSQPVDENDTVFIAGNSPRLGNWKPDGSALQRLDSLTWTASFSFPKGERLEYKFTRGSWQNEAVVKGCATPSNSLLTVLSSQTVYHSVTGWKDDCAALPPEITGTAVFHREIKSQFLENPRDVVVWLPPSYEAGKDRYPVLYMHDGQNIFDPHTSTLGFDWRLDEVATALIAEGKIREIIIVGIYNTDERTAEYSPAHLGPDYTRFLMEELKPFIDSHYRTLTDPANTAVMGSSMGGLISFDLAWEHPDVFGMAGCLSSAFLVDNNEILKRVAKTAKPPLTVKFYLDNGTKGLEKKLSRGFRKMAKLLKKKGYTEGVNLVIYKDEGAEHSETAWAHRVHRPLLFFFGK